MKWRGRNWVYCAYTDDKITTKFESNFTHIETRYRAISIFRIFCIENSIKIKLNHFKYNHLSDWKVKMEKTPKPKRLWEMEYEMRQNVIAKRHYCCNIHFQQQFDIVRKKVASFSNFQFFSWIFLIYPFGPFISTIWSMAIVCSYAQSRNDSP